VKEHYHKDNLRHLPRFPGFFVTFRILVTSLYILLSCRHPSGRVGGRGVGTRHGGEENVRWVNTRIHSLTSLPCRSLPFSSRTPEGPAVGRVTRCEGNDMTTKNPMISTSLGSSLSRHVGSLTIPLPLRSSSVPFAHSRFTSFSGMGNEM